MSDLTRAQTKFLKKHGSPAVRRYVEETKGKLSDRTAAFSAVAAAARAERKAEIEVRRLELTRLDDDPQAKLNRLEGERRSLAQENEELRKALTTLRALPSMAVHSED